MTTQEKITVIEQVASEIGGQMYEDYSGRGMYGQTCIGITCADPQGCIEEAAARGLRGSRTDNMGKEYIVYWPSVRRGKEER